MPMKPGIDIVGAQLEPLHGYHYFHEGLNVHVKTAVAAGVLLVRYAADPNVSGELGKLIELSDPAWNSPPIHDMSIEAQRQFISAVSALAIVGAFSALDDLLIATRAERDRWNAISQDGKDAVVMKDLAKAGSHVDLVDDGEEAIDRHYRLNGWDSGAVASYRDLIRYFRLCRNCIAHRSARASPALSGHSQRKEVASAFATHCRGLDAQLPEFETNDRVVVDPKLAIFCSHVLREVALDTNRQLVSELGVDGVVNMAAYHSMFGDRRPLSSNHGTPAAAINAVLTHHYRVKLKNAHNVIRVLKRAGTWNRYRSAFCELKSG